MRYALIITITCLFFVSCKKDSSAGPQLTFKSVNTTVLNNGDVIKFTLSFKDPSGGGADSILIKEVVPNCPASNFSDTLPMPAFSAYKGESGDITFPITYNPSGSYDYYITGPHCGVNDTAYFRFVLKDNAGHASDTVNSPNIVIVN
jgi:hypothetical protein